jgi:hypothetical protein
MYVQNFIQRYSHKINSILLRIIALDFDVIHPTFCSSDNGEKLGVQWDCTPAFCRIEQTCDSVRSVVLYYIFTDFDIPVMLLAPIRMCLNETYSKFHIGEYLYDAFHIQNGQNVNLLSKNM